MTRTRGAVLYETAVVLPLVLLLTLSAIRFGLAGYAQMQTDAAAWMTARYTAIGVGAAPAASSAVQYAKTLYPGTNGYNYATPVANPAPTASAPINWGQVVQCEYNNSYGCNYDANGNYVPNGGYRSNESTTNRHGGSSVIVPMQLTTNVSTTTNSGQGFFAVLAGGITKLLGISSSNVEPFFQECGELYGWGLTSNSCVNGATSTNVVNWSNRTTPPYYMSTTYLQYCSVAGATQSNSGFWAPFNYTNTGPCSQQVFTALGNGAMLNIHNYYRTTPGANGMAVITGSTAFPVFRELACHQRVYAQLANVLNSYGTGAPGAADYTIVNVDPFLPTTASFGSGAYPGLVQTIYNWDRDFSTNEALNGGNELYPDYVAGYQTHALAGCGSPVYYWQPHEFNPQAPQGSITP